MYGKIFKSMFEGTMRGKPNVLLVWTNMLVNSDKDGYVDRTVRVISEETGLSINAVNESIIELESPDSESRSQDLEGRRLERIDEHRNWGWRIVNYLKYASIKNEEERREQNRLAQSRFRAKNQRLVSNSKRVVSNSKQASAESAHVAIAVDIDRTKDVSVSVKKEIYKETYSECVKLTKDEFSKLTESFGIEGTNQRIQNLNDYIMSKGAKYKSHYHTILNWERKNETNGTNRPVFVNKAQALMDYNIQSGKEAMAFLEKKYNDDGQVRDEESK